MRLVNDFGECGIDYLFLSQGNKILGARLYSSTLTTLKSFIAQISDGYKFEVFSSNKLQDIPSSKSTPYFNVTRRVPIEYNNFFDSILAIKDINSRCVITTAETIEEDFYNMLLNNFSLPIMREWVPVLIDKLKSKSLINKGRIYYKDGTRTIDLYGNGIRVELQNLILYDLSALVEEKLEGIISECLKNREIMIVEKDIENTTPLELDGGLGQYMALYGSGIVENKEKEIMPLAEMAGAVKNVAYLGKKPYPQQATCVNGMIELAKRSRYGFMIEEMGTGKSLQALLVAEGIAINKYLRMYPGRTLKDAYKENAINYRAIIMCPGHLLEKWAAEIKENVPYAKVTIITVGNFGKLCELRNTKPNGKEYYIISKDTAKLSYPVFPVPTQSSQRPLTVRICKHCYEERRNQIVLKYGKGCAICGSTDHKIIKVGNGGENTEFHGLKCPDCDSLLIRNFKSIDELNHDNIMHADDFSKHTESNDKCFNCGCKLWQPAVQPIGKARKIKWVKFRHFSNYKKKTITSRFVLRKNANSTASNFEKGLMISGNEEDSIEEITLNKRKVSMAEYIKKYLSFDICILDEAHKYEGAGTAQSVAAQAIVSRSKFTLCLTGTLLNGKASSIFYLLYMLDPRRMQEYGYRYSDEMKFSYKYGCVEQIYAYDGNGEGEYKVTSKGRLIKPATVKPGISPLLYIDFLFDKSVMLSISDMSQFMPKLVERVIPVPLEEDIRDSYKVVMTQLKSLVHESEGRSVLGDILTTGLSYTDKPYGRKPIMSSYSKNKILCSMPSLQEYEDGELTNKEKELIDIVKQEIAENRNVFVFCSYTGSGDLCITGRLKEIIEDECNLKDEVYILEASSPAPIKREAFFHKKAAEGIKVFICNYKVVETGMDFRFLHEGEYYNYPTVIFYQIGYELASVWQASGRAYRLNQVEECRVFYLASMDTIQIDALQILAEKKAAVSAIQGKFSCEGLAAMAKGVDEKVRLAQALSENYTSDINNVENMFDVINQSESVKLDNEIIHQYNEAISFKVLMNIEDVTNVEETVGNIFSYLEYADVENPVQYTDVLGNEALSLLSLENEISNDVILKEPAAIEVNETVTEEVEEDFTVDSIEKFLFENVVYSNVIYNEIDEDIEDITENKNSKSGKETKKSKEKRNDKQCSLFDFL